MERALTKQILFWLSQQPRIWFLKTAGGLYQRRGVPDIIGCVKGKFFAIEVKSPGGELSNSQVVELNGINAAFGRASVVRSIEEAKEFIGRLRS